LASARASSGEADAVVVAAAGGGTVAASWGGGDGGGTIVGIDVSNWILSGHFLVEWMRAIGTSAEPCAEVSSSATGAALGQIQFTTKSNATSTLPT